jgi:hypothetical protein
MYSHNINPISGANFPQYMQVYESALKHGLQKNEGKRQPEMPRKPISAHAPSEPVIKTPADIADMRSILPMDGPKLQA